MAHTSACVYRNGAYQFSPARPETDKRVGGADEGTKPERSMKIARELHEIRRETTRKLIAEELFADDSFVIFQRQLHTAQQLVNEALRKADEERKNIVPEKDSKNEKSSQA